MGNQSCVVVMDALVDDRKPFTVDQRPGTGAAWLIHHPQRYRASPSHFLLAPSLSGRQPQLSDHGNIRPK
ncbi:hypothetical protein PGT21_026563 [Puccinia graminis f. sp. tritici]|uniref:Uncharacterized protein n=1 Tax=Puccinia graminis f. sp. tritici TaxID=56615 RepID=A0A5B0PBL8_PUCGR|nr:hypothetical protein PGT21_026563 [Puccinia graminis f. sp. tritici]KAA1117025.1 hypothetical protein PGTUg99_034268 [Puccinia graminis f. sp. tritici]